MWTVVVEVNFADGTGPAGVFQLGKWRQKHDAYNFSKELEFKFGEHRINTHVVFASTYISWWRDEFMRSHFWLTKPTRSVELPPCDYDEMGYFRVRNANATEKILASSAQDAADKFLELHPDEQYNTLFIEEI